MSDEPMAILRWDFVGPRGHRIKGEHEMRQRSDAERTRDLMNSQCGHGSHWVEVLNKTWSEHLAEIGT